MKTERLALYRPIYMYVRIYVIKIFLLKYIYILYRSKIRLNVGLYNFKIVVLYIP